MKPKNTIIVSLAAGCAASLALGDLPPGYTWGIANCGPAQTDSAAECRMCCLGAQRDGDINSIEREGCEQMCDESNFTRPSFWSEFWRGAQQNWWWFYS